MRSVVGERETEKALQLGLLYSCDDALQVGLVDEVVSESETLAAAQHQLSRWNQVPRESMLPTYTPASTLLWQLLIRLYIVQHYFTDI